MAVAAAVVLVGSFSFVTRVPSHGYRRVSAVLACLGSPHLQRRPTLGQSRQLLLPRALRLLSRLRLGLQFSRCLDVAEPRLRVFNVLVVASQRLPASACTCAALYHAHAFDAVSMVVRWVVHTHGSVLAVRTPPGQPQRPVAPPAASSGRGIALLHQPPPLMLDAARMPRVL